MVFFMDNRISGDLLRKLSAADFALYADYEKGVTPADVFYKDMLAIVSAANIFHNNFVKVVFSSDGFDFAVDGFESGSLLNFIRPKLKVKQSEEDVDKQRLVAGRCFWSLLNFLRRNQRLTKEDWQGLAADFNSHVEQECGTGFAEMAAVNERFALNEASKFCKKVGFGRVSRFNIYVAVVGNVQKLEVVQAVNDAYVEDMLFEGGDIVYDGAARLFVKKPDVGGDSRWEVYWQSERIPVKITDYGWLSDVHQLGIEFGSKSYIDVNMKVFLINNASGRPIKKYVVEKVNGGNYEK